MIKISLTVELEAADLAALGSQWAALFAQVVAPAAMFAHEVTPPAKAIERPVLRKTPVLVAEPPAPQPSPEIATIAPATQEGEERPAKRNKRLVPTLPWDEYDKLVRREMKRLSLDKRLPGRKLWDEQRDRRLPTLDAVRMRYKCSTLAQLAEELGMDAPLHGGATVAEAEANA